MDQALAMQALRHARAFEQLDRSLFQNPGADARLDMGAAAPLENHGLDSRQMEQLRQQKACRSGADNGDLRAHAPTLEHAMADGDSNR